MRTVRWSLAAFIALALLAPGTARATPLADLVVVWAPGVAIAPIATVTRELGIALIDRSPPPASAPPAIAPLVQRGIAAYGALQFAEALAILDQARDLADRTGGAGLGHLELSDLALYRGLVQTQLGNTAAAWDELVAALVIDPTRVLDPARFPPRVIAEVERARVAVEARAIAKLELAPPPSCTVTVDGVATAGKVSARVGAHWVRASCGDRPAWGARVALTAEGSRVAIGGTPYAPPEDAELVVQARVAAVRGLVIVEVRNGLAVARLIALDGRERDRRTVTVAQDLAPLADAIRTLVTPARVVAQPWYRRSWVWVAGGALATAVIAIPITAFLASDRTSSSAEVRLSGAPPWPR